MKKLWFLLLIGFICSQWACSVSKGYYHSQESVKLDRVNAERVAQDIIAQLKKRFGPGHTTFVAPKNRVKGRVRKSLEEGLRKAGYAVTTETNLSGAVRLAYLIDKLDSGKILLRLVAGENYQSSWMYERHKDGHLLQASGLTVRR